MLEKSHADLAAARLAADEARYDLARQLNAVSCADSITALRCRLAGVSSMLGPCKASNDIVYDGSCTTSPPWRRVSAGAGWMAAAAAAATQDQHKPVTHSDGMTAGALALWGKQACLQCCPSTGRCPFCWPASSDCSSCSAAVAGSGKLWLHVVIIRLARNIELNYMPFMYFNQILISNQRNLYGTLAMSAAAGVPWSGLNSWLFASHAYCCHSSSQQHGMRSESINWCHLTMACAWSVCLQQLTAAA